MLLALGPGPILPPAKSFGAGVAANDGLSRVGLWESPDAMSVVVVLESGLGRF